ncbi:MAG: PAS domain S-box protein [Calothrix sp. FI2-JRJ7]|jgi:PAS domain S-box-containing protein|nr:PAS domain S-box protein [Calothrix sp. FI2-JRJ7]
MTTELTVLIIDNSPSERELYRHFLQQDAKYNYTILEASTGKSGLESWRRFQPDVILLDFLLPDIDGLELIDELKKQIDEQPRTFMPAAIMITGQGNEAVAVQAMKTGVQDYLVKRETTPDILRSTLHSAVANVRLRRKLLSSEERFRTSIENSLDCFGFYSAVRNNEGNIIDFRFEYVNAAACEANMLSKEEQLGKLLCELFPATRTTGLFDEYCRVVETGQPLIKESLVYTDVFGKQLSTRVFDIRISKMGDGIVASWRDVTAKKHTEDFIERIATATPGILYVYDLVEQRNVYVNRQIGEVLGYTTTEIEAMGVQLFGLLMHPEDLQRLPQMLGRFNTLQDGDTVETEYRMRHKNGEWRWLLSKEVIFKRNFDNSPRQIVGTALDITEHKRTEESLRKSNERFQLAARAVNSLIYDWDTEANTIQRSDGITRIFGYNDSEVEPTAQGWYELIHPDDINDFKSALDAIIAKQDCYSLSYRVRSKDGNYRYVEDKGKIIRNSQGDVARVVGNATDITVAKQTQTALRDSEAKFRRIVDSNFVGVYFGDASGRIYEANNAFLEMFGYTGADIETGVLRWDTMTPSEFKELDAKKIQELQLNGFCTLFEKEYFHKDGTRVPILLGIAQMEGREDGYSACFIINLTQLKQTEAALRQSEERYKHLLELEEKARQSAETANLAKDEFVAMVSHDLRSPLNAILGWAKLLQTRKFDEAATQKALQTIERNARSQAKLLEDLLDISRILRSKLQLELAPVNLYTVVTAAIETAYPGANAKNIRFVTVLDNSIPPISGDIHRLQQVMGNLLSNALKFTDVGGRIEVYLSIKHTWQGNQHLNYIQIDVKDTGIGIKPEFLPQVFERYQQDNSSGRRQGLGLGLAIASHIIELHGGTITATSLGEGQGSTFTIRFPFNNDPP